MQILRHCAGTSFYLTHSSFRPFHMTAGTTTLITIPSFQESGSTHFGSVY